MTHTTLGHVLRETGWTVVIHDDPERHPDHLGNPCYGQQCAVLSGGRIAIKQDSWDLAFAASHELAEVDHHFQHDETLFCNQANLLAWWHMLRAGSRPEHLHLFAPKGTR